MQSRVENLKIEVPELGCTLFTLQFHQATRLPRMLNIISLLFLGALVRPSDSVIIKSPKDTNWGKWHNMEYCPPKMYAVGVQLKVDEDQVIDKTGLNAVALYCNPLNSSLYTNKHPIMSGVGPFGNWKSIRYCPLGEVAVGFYLYTKKVPIGAIEGILKAISPLIGPINLEIGGEYEKITEKKLILMIEHTLSHEKEVDFVLGKGNA
ncbi:hypothetical protein WR25_22488 [Diploscapter pachys]|uniref:Uncharacterized protein n=1 Tax=Diploscapter pachys TaxID=2018661 RepID=A0A2A2JHV8_9BILA|nr:hypothetical protein WR25_22488 [Diploscapter pachys]